VITNNFRDTWGGKNLNQADHIAAGKATLEVTGVMRHRRGAVSRLVPGDEVHRMHNSTARDTVEIHVYGKDLVDLRRKTWTDDGTEKPLISAKYLNC